MVYQMKQKKERGFKRTCFKRRLKTERVARKVLSDTRKKGREEIRYYFCRDCNAWHLTSRKRILIFNEEIMASDS